MTLKAIMSLIHAYRSQHGALPSAVAIGEQEWRELADDPATPHAYDQVTE